MPVGTQGTVKGVDPGRLRETGAQMILANTYHLALRPGEQTVAALGGLHAFMGWDGPILTDSGGFQVFSLADRMTVDESGVRFRSHIDGAAVELTPERSVAIQEQLGSDVAMVFDHVVALPNIARVVADAMRRSVRWAERCQAAATRADQALFAIVQGGLDAELRAESAERLVALDFVGYAIGGLSVGEPPRGDVRGARCDGAAVAARSAAVSDGRRPADRFVGRDQPRRRLVRLRDADAQRPQCAGVHRFGPGAAAESAAFALDREPLDAACPCPACRHSRGYLRHLFQASEMLGPMLVSMHNLTYYQRLMAEARRAIAEDGCGELLSERRRGVGSGRR